MVGFDVRNMRENDLEGLIKLNNNINCSKFDSLFQENKNKVIVAQLNDDIIGYVKFKILKNITYKNIIFIDEILVDEMYRGLGVGYQLMVEAEKGIKDYKDSSLVVINNRYLGVEEVFYDRQGFNLNSNRFYEKKYCI